MDPLSNKHHFGSNGVTQLKHVASIPMCSLNNKERKERLTRCSPAIFYEIITNVPFKALNHKTMEKPNFMFGNKVLASDEEFYYEESKWLHRVGDLYMFLPDME